MDTPAVTRALLPRQRRFVEEFVRDFNGTQAYIRAGYSPNNTDVSASRLLGDVRVQQAVAEKSQAITQGAHWDVQRWLEGVGQIAEHGESEAARVSAYALLAKYLGISDKVDHRVVHARLPEGLTLEELRALAGVGEPFAALAPPADQSA